MKEPEKICTEGIDFLLQNAPVNILYRTKKEILGEPVDTPEMQSLQEKITELPKVKKAFSVQNENGFFGTSLHGIYFLGFDSTVELLKKNGIEPDDPHLQKAKVCLDAWKDYEKDSFYQSGNAMDEHGRGGFRAIWAEQLLELGADESHPRIAEQIRLAMEAFSGALLHSSVDDFSKNAIFRGQPCRYYIKGAHFPAANHIRILEKTRSWRTEENLSMVRRSFAHCKEIMRDYHDGFLYVNCGYFVGPFNYHWNARKERITMERFENCPIDFAWFMKGLGSPSVSYPIFETPDNGFSASLYEMLSDPHFIEKIGAEQMRMFKNYASIAPSWRKKESIACDILFPILRALQRM